VGQTYTMDDASIVRAVRDLAGGLTEDEAALVRMLTPSDLNVPALAEHKLDLVDLLETIRSDETMADYVYAIAPDWDGTIESLLLGAKVTTIFTNHQLEHRALVPAA
jgi:hypothetical protein